MKHKAMPSFWYHLRALPAEARRQANSNFVLLKLNPRHPSVRLKRVGPYWSARAGSDYRSLDVARDGALLWFWIGGHDEYERIIGNR